MGATLQVVQQNIYSPMSIYGKKIPLIFLMYRVVDVFHSFHFLSAISLQYYPTDRKTYKMLMFYKFNGKTNTAAHDNFASRLTKLKLELRESNSCKHALNLINCERQHTITHISSTRKTTYSDVVYYRFYVLFWFCSNCRKCLLCLHAAFTNWTRQFYASLPLGIGHFIRSAFKWTKSCIGRKEWREVHGTWELAV